MRLEYRSAGGIISVMFLTSFAVMPSGGLLISVRKQTFWLKKRREYNIMI